MIYSEESMSTRINCWKVLQKSTIIDKLVFYEVYDDINNAITREKQIKGGSRAKKIKLIEEMNNEWNDLFNEI